MHEYMQQLFLIFRRWVKKNDKYDNQVIVVNLYFHQSIINELFTRITQIHVKLAIRTNRKQNVHKHLVVTLTYNLLKNVYTVKFVAAKELSEENEEGY